MLLEFVKYCVPLKVIPSGAFISTLFLFAFSAHSFASLSASLRFVFIMSCEVSSVCTTVTCSLTSLSPPFPSLAMAYFTKYPPMPNVAIIDISIINITIVIIIFIAFFFIISSPYNF